MRPKEKLKFGLIPFSTGNSKKITFLSKPLKQNPDSAPYIERRKNG
jgi:hypothetical protein